MIDRTFDGTFDRAFKDILDGTFDGTSERMLTAIGVALLACLIALEPTMWHKAITTKTFLIQ